MNNLEYTYIPRHHLLNEAVSIVDRGEYLLVTCPPRSGLSTFLNALYSRLRESYTICAKFSPDNDSNFVEMVQRAVCDALVDNPQNFYQCQMKCPAVDLFFNDQTPPQCSNLTGVVILDGLDRLLIEAQRRIIDLLREAYYARDQCQTARRIRFVIGGNFALSLISPDRRSPFLTEARMALRDFSLRETRDFLSRFLTPRGIELRETSQYYLYDMTLGHPHLLNSICRTLVKAMPAEGGKPPFSLVHWVVKEAGTGQDILFHDVCKRLADLEGNAKNILVRVLNGAPVEFDETKEQGLTRLNLTGVIATDERHAVRIRNPIYEQFLRNDPLWASNTLGDQVPPLSDVVLPTPTLNRNGFELLFKIETALRNFISCKMFEQYGTDWHLHIPDVPTPDVPTSVLSKLQNRHRAEGADPQTPLLSYADLLDLFYIIFDQWDKGTLVFAKHFGGKERLKAFFESLNIILRKIAHNRNLSETELSQFEAVSEYFYEFMGQPRSK